jgi:serine/threonine-protein kinase
MRCAFESGESVGRWRVERPIKAGRLFEVWAARDAAGLRAAVKTPRPLERNDDSARAILRHEHDCLRALEHAHVVSVHELVDTASRTALVTEWLDGGDLVSVAGFAPRHWLASLGELVEAVAQLHGHGFVHRDIKARNVMLDARGRARLIDFASAARIGAVVPRGGTTDAHTRADDRGGRATCDDDAYGLAVLIYELFTGRLPYGVDGRVESLEDPRPSGEGAPNPVLGWAKAWLDPARRAHAGNVTVLAAVLNLADSS